MTWLPTDEEGDTYVFSEPVQPLVYTESFDRMFERFYDSDVSESFLESSETSWFVWTPEASEDCSIDPFDPSYPLEVLSKMWIVVPDE